MIEVKLYYVVEHKEWADVYHSGPYKTWEEARKAMPQEDRWNYCIIGSKIIGE